MDDFYSLFRKTIIYLGNLYFDSCCIAIIVTVNSALGCTFLPVDLYTDNLKCVKLTLLENVSMWSMISGSKPIYSIMIWKWLLTLASPWLHYGISRNSSCQQCSVKISYWQDNGFPEWFMSERYQCQQRVEFHYTCRYVYQELIDAGWSDSKFSDCVAGVTSSLLMN